MESIQNACAGSRLRLMSAAGTSHIQFPIKARGHGHEGRAAVRVEVPT